MNDFQKKLSDKLQAGINQVRRQRMEADRRELMSTVGQDVAKMLQPFLMEIAKVAKTSKESVRDSMHEALGAMNAREMQIDTAPIISAIEQAFMGIQIPEPKVTVNLPPFDISKIPVPDMTDVRGFMRLIANKEEVGYDNPLPVVLYDGQGNPLKFFENLKQVVSGGGGGKSDFFTIKGFSASAFAELMNPDGRLKVELPTGSSGLTDAELRASSVPVAQASGATWSTSVVEIFGSAASSMLNGDNRLRVAVDTGTASLTDAELRASAVPVSQVSGAKWSTEASLVSVSDIFSSTAASNVVNSDNRVKVELPATTVTVSSITASAAAAIIDSSGVQYSGSNPVPITIVSNGVATTAANIVDSSGVAYSGSNPLPVTGPVVVTSITNSTQAALIDSSGVQYSGSNPVPVTGSVTVSGGITSTVVVGDTVSDAVDSGSAPLKNGGIARTTNPTAVADGDRVAATYDDVGRELIRPVQVRDLIRTARVAVTNGTETTLLAASAGAYHDLIYLLGANNSDAAVSVDIRGITAGNVLLTLQLPANGTAGVATPVPLPQDETGNNWTIDLPDITGSTVTITALFSKEV